MSYRASVVSPLPSYGVGTMPGHNSSRGLTTYSSAYTRTSSASRKPPVSSYTSTSRPNSRQLPPGPGPLDSSGRKLTSLSSSTRAGPLKADHSYFNSTRDYPPSTSTLPRKYSTSQNASTKDIGNRSQRSRSIASLDRVTNNFSHVSLNGHSDSVRSRPSEFDDGIGRASRKERFNFDTKTDDNRTGSRVSRISNLDNNNKALNDDIFTPRDKDAYNSRASSVTRDFPRDIFGVKRKDSLTDTQPSKSLSRQSSSSSISNGNSAVAKYSSSGKVGLRNIGNTCFMNSVLQCLSNTKPLLEYCLQEDYILDKNKTTSKLKGALMIAYASLISSFWKDKNSSYVSPNAFKSQIQKFAPRFSGYQQQDAQEFLRYLLEGLHEDVNRVTEKPKHKAIDDDKFTSDSEKAAEYWNNYLRYDQSRIVEIFVGQLKSELKFDECGHRSVTFDPFWDLSLPIPKYKSEMDLVDCLSLFMKEEILDGDESPTCAKCKKRRSCTKRFSIQKFPPVVVFHLKRFSQERFSRKLTTLVNFPITNLDLSEFAAEKCQQPRYNLYAVSEHSGTTFGGHYTAKARHAYTGEWHDFNDTRVSPCGANQAVSSEAYVLFYELASSQSRL